MKKVIDGDTILFTFNDGVAPLRFDVTTASVACRNHATMHGFKQRLGDAAAGCDTEQARRDAINVLAQHYETGTDQWNIRTASGATAKSDQAAIELLAEMMEISVEEARMAYMAKKAEKAA